VSRKPEIVLIEDHGLLRESLTMLFREGGYRVSSFEELHKARKHLVRKRDSDILVISDIRLPDGSGYELLEQSNLYPVIFMTAYGQIEDAVEAISRGARDFILKPFSNEEIMARVKKVLSSFSDDEESEQIKGVISQYFIGESEAIKRLQPYILAAIRSDSTVLLTGESGTGKNLLARLIHDLGKRRDKPFQLVTCSSLPRTLIESELFGYEAGAFTGAEKTKTGKLEYADGGTVFLDEIGELDREIQVMLLRFLQDKSFERIGGNKTLHSDVRIITATNVDPGHALETGRLREDLYYRLNVVHIPIPPLREHPEDIELYFKYFNKIFARRFKVQPKVFAKEIIDYSRKLPWHGNIREIENLVERLFALYPEQYISLADFVDVQQTLAGEKPGERQEEIRGQGLSGNLRDILQRTEEKYINEALRRSHGNKSEAARLLGVSRTALLHKIQKYGLDNNS